MQLWLPIVALLFLRLLSCNTPAVSEAAVVSPVPLPASVTAEPPNRGRVRRSSMRAEKWMFVYAGKTETDRNRLRLMLEEIARHRPLDKEIEVVDFAQEHPTRLAQFPLVFVGNVLPEDFLDLTPGLESPATYRNVPLQEPGDMLWIRYGLNPWSPADSLRSVHLAYGPEVTSLREKLYERYADNWEQMFWSGWDYELERGGQPLLKGYFANRGWTPDPESEIRYSAGDDRPVRSDDGWLIHAPEGLPTGPVLERTMLRLSEARENVGRLLGRPVLDSFNLHLYPSVERIGMRRRSMEWVQYDEKGGSIHLVVDKSANRALGPRLEYALLRHLRGKDYEATSDFIDAGLAAYSNVNYATRYRRFATALAGSGMLFDPAEMNDPEQRYRNSTLLWDISTLAVIDYLLESDRLTPDELSADKVKERLENLPADWQSTLAARNLPARPAPSPDLRFLGGMTFAHEGYRVYNGYGGKTVKPSLDSLATLNVNALAVVPYTFQRQAAVVGDLPVSNSTGGENDWAVTHSIREGHARGWTVLLKPQIWVGDAWPGDINFGTDEEWELFFSRYAEWIAHYAMLAELEDVEALCIGTEMVRSTIDHPEEWRRMIKLLRKLYGGRLTYAANWGEEFERMTFWDELDVIGLNSYYPLTDNAEPADAELLAGASDWVDKAEAVAARFDKDWWLTEVGYRSVHRSWQNPHADAGDRPVSEDCQRRCFAALTTALEDADRFRGMFIWKWPSYLGRGQTRRNPGIGFTPGGKAAAAEIKAFYRRKSQ